ncbi:MAG: hypothetical protein A3I61_02000 [Acidobacteria bacterium RIFCSPLOWO2_02_FULL_68_18]|nr:MAG: hypothetical protein A3I61_02000 [Acidobacteria bacterium RIFCSPLOWO2_02_FULL_68_18]OFW50249.1 MAG: hypothetical protein A3G77_09780 [Acidobacteria bacterium RIFCSPLOWO2_12_FULL_68_19]
MTYRRACVLGAAAVVGLCTSATAQTRTFAARLSVVPITVAMQDSVAGRGAATAVLTGNRLTIDGTFEGLRSPATTARLHVAPRALRGPAIADLAVSGTTRGTLKGAVELNDEERGALEKLSLYVQINSEKAPEGNLWGWLFPQEVKR